jgi:tetratricopeptide (TPR) repeat protein/transcriptional regulator with XRE-family HTH domain
VFADVVRAHRRRLGLTQEELAERAGLSVRGVRKLEAGRVDVPRPATVRLLADAFGLTGRERDRFFQEVAGVASGYVAGGPDGRRAAGPVASELPPDVFAFTGREDQLAWLDALASGADPPGAVVISALSGAPGIGKTALAVHWAHRVAHRFPDGQLFVNLRGYGPDRPLRPGDVLIRFLTALGVPRQDIPLEVDDRAARYRTELASRRMLVVLDNAVTADQVRPLLPGGGSCAVAVTSRDNLAGLVAIDGARRLDLDLLRPDEAIELLRALVGKRVDAEPNAAATLADQCARLPLALRIGAELAASRPAMSLAGLVAELADQRRRVSRLDAGGDPRAAVGVVFSWSIQHLPEETARTFQHLGLHPGPDIDPYAAAALTHAGLDRVRRDLDLLFRAHLVHVTSPGRYGMHDLLRAYAINLADAHHTANDQRQAVGRLFDYYLAAAAAAMDTLYPTEAHLRPRVPPPDTHHPDLTNSDTARDWLDAERACLVSVAARAATDGWPTHATRLSATLDRYLDGGHYTDALAVHGHAHAAAQQAEDLVGQADALRSLGLAHMQLGRYRQAAQRIERALALFHQAGDRAGEAHTLANLGVLSTRLGHTAQAAQHLQRALVLCRQIGDRTGQGRILNNISIVELQRGQYESAASHAAEALAIHRQTGDRTSQAHTLTNLGIVEQRLGRHTSAGRRHRQAIALFRQTGNLRGEGHALDNLGTMHIPLGQPDQAVEYLTQAHTVFRQLGDRDGEAQTLNGLGEAAHTAKRPADAIARHTAALTIAVDVGARDQRARAHAGLGHALQDLGDHSQARAHYAHALALYSELGLPEADAVRTSLAALNQP